MARPSIGASRRGTLLHFRVSEAEKREIDEARGDESRSDFIRRAVRDLVTSRKARRG